MVRGEKSKMRSYIAILLLVLLFLVSTSPASAIKASAGKAKAFLNVDLTNGEPAVIERTLAVNNINEYPVEVTIRPEGIAEEIVNLTQNKVILESNTSVDVPYTITVDRTGNLTVILLVQFSAVNEEDSKGNAGIAAEITIYSGSSDGSFDDPSSDGGDGGNTVKKSRLVPILVISGMAVLIIIVIFLIFRMERKK